MRAHEVEPPLGDQFIQVLDASPDDLDLDTQGGRALGEQPQESLRGVDTSHAASGRCQPHRLRSLPATDVQNMHSRSDEIGQLAGDDFLADHVAEGAQVVDPATLSRVEPVHCVMIPRTPLPPDPRRWFRPYWAP